MSAPSLRYLSAAEIDACLPATDERLELAAQALSALGHGSAEMPPKIGVHPRPGALLHAMPAWMRDGDLLGMKWIAVFPANRSHGLPAINGLIVLNDAETGLPTWIMDAARITAVRTATVSGVAIRLFASPSVSRVALLGGGVQAHSHAELLRDLLPDAEAVVFDPHADRAQLVVDAHVAAGGRASAAASARDAAAGAEVVITVAGMGGQRQQMATDWIAPGALVVAVDFATYAPATLAHEAAHFVVDDRKQFLAYRDAGYFDGYPDPDSTLGEVLDAGEPEPRTGAPVLVTHLGVGLADVLFADAVARRATAAGAGTELAR